MGAFAYERAWFDREAGGWPDLRELDWSRLHLGQRPPYPPYWCHGAPGIGLARLRAWTLTGDSLALAEAAAAVDTATASAFRAAGEPADLSLCHGAGSVIELHLVAAEVTGDPEHLAVARRLADLALAAAGLRGPNAQPGLRGPNAQPGLRGPNAQPGLRGPNAQPGLRGPNAQPAPVPCGVPGGGETPGLLLGLAGVAATLLRLADPSALPSPLLVAAWDGPYSRRR